MVSATRWRQDRKLDPTNPYQRVRQYITFPSGGGGYSSFGWSPQPIDGALKLMSPAGVVAGSGLSGLAAPLLPSAGKIVAVLGAIVGAWAGAKLARANLER